MGDERRIVEGVAKPKAAALAEAELHVTRKV